MFSFLYQNLKRIYFKNLFPHKKFLLFWSLRHFNNVVTLLCLLFELRQLRMFSDQQQDLDGYSIKGDIAFPNGLDGRKGTVFKVIS